MTDKHPASWLSRQLMQPLWLIIAVAALIVAAAIVTHDCRRDAAAGLLDMELTADTTIDITPQQVRSIERIGKWEFLSIADEELIDTTRNRIIGPDDHLARIYHGTLRLGIDLARCRPGWLLAHGDSVSLTVPHIQLLNTRFIDEARTVAFYESGTWTPADKEAMYQRAAARMRARALTPDNRRLAQDNARRQLTALMRSFGFNVVEVRFDD